MLLYRLIYLFIFLLALQSQYENKILMCCQVKVMFLRIQISALFFLVKTLWLIPTKFAQHLTFMKYNEQWILAHNLLHYLLLLMLYTCLYL